MPDKDASNGGNGPGGMACAACLLAALSAPLLWPIAGVIPGLASLVPLLRKDRFERLLFYGIYLWALLILSPLRHMD